VAKQHLSVKNGNPWSTLSTALIDRDVHWRKSTIRLERCSKCARHWAVKVLWK